ncbi:hypothetical protein U27_06559 [Candidatus Vecturithrix granuli]|uniref:Uncharacterized protein n=1 Tax=Vecturithrix granuli TaxID=1499967 RepID=A0A081C4R9_VECG1|nr:hypothetical protein U27_06559 [Candidatus Vecturithrix granuli]
MKPMETIETIEICEIAAQSVQRLGLEAVISGDIQQFQNAIRMTPSGGNCTLPEILSLTNTFWNMQKTCLFPMDQEKI